MIMTKEDFIKSIEDVPDTFEMLFCENGMTYHDISIEIDYNANVIEIVKID